MEVRPSKSSPERDLCKVVRACKSFLGRDSCREVRPRKCSLGRFIPRLLPGRRDRSHHRAPRIPVGADAHVRCSLARYGPVCVGGYVPGLRPCSAEEEHRVTGVCMLVWKHKVHQDLPRRTPSAARRPRRDLLNSPYHSSIGFKHTHIDLCHFRMQNHECDS